MNKGIVCVTGGLGFIGSHLIRELRNQGYSVRVMDNLSPQIHGHLPTVDGALALDPGIQVTRADLNGNPDLGGFLQGADHLVHLASETGTAQSMYEIAQYNAVNSQGTARLMDWLVNAKHSIKKVILASSRSIYGEGAYLCGTCGVVTPPSRRAEALTAGRWEPVCPGCQGPLQLIATPEHSRPAPASIYAATKLAQEDLVRIACGSSGIPFGILRFQNVYGEGQSLKNPYTGILSIFSTRIRRGLVLPIFEDGLESRDFVHVGDVVKAIRLCLESEAVVDQTFNVGSGIPTSVLDVASMLIQVFKGRSVTEVTGQYRLGDIRHCYADIAALRSATGFEPEMGLETGLARFAAWVASQPLPEDGLDRANQVLIDKGLMK
jgi:dTDP-L-rhamnose 4-epimerase